MAKLKVELIYSDDDIIVINKPTGLSVTADRSGAAQLLDILAEYFSPEAASQLRLIHRLDKDTSGVMILARNLEAQSMFSSFFTKRQVKKTYLAIVTGIVPGKQGRINASLAHNNKNPAIMSVTCKKGKKASTNWKLLADFGSAALLAVSPLTGRTHQIRVHLPSIGLPLAIDPLYGSNQPLLLSNFKHDYQLGKNQTEKPLIDRLTLHAYQLQFAEPQPNQPDCFVAALDKKFASTIKMLTKHNPNGLNAFVNTDDFSKIIEGKRL